MNRSMFIVKRLLKGFEQNRLIVNRTNTFISRWKRKKIELACCGLISSGLTTLAIINYRSIALTTLTPSNLIDNYGAAIPGLKVYKSSDVAKHNSLENGGRIWVIYKSGVYDITDFIKDSQHPGGDKILLAAGGDIEPFWNLYAVHKSDQIYRILEEYRIGNLSEEDVLANQSSADNDPYADDPVRPGYFSVRSSKPFNAEPPLNILVDKWTTPK